MSIEDNAKTIFSETDAHKLDDLIALSRQEREKNAIKVTSE